MSKHGMTIEVDSALLGRRTNRVAVPDRAFAINAKEESDGKRVAEMLLYDIIGMDFFGEGLTAKRVKEELDALGAVDELVVLINSPGGVIYEALGIYDALVRNPAKVITHNVGAAWSCAGWILQAGDERLSSENATTMIHNSQNCVCGDRRAMAKEAEVLDKMDATIASTFARRTGRKEDTFRKLMDDETWYDGHEALAAKIVDRVVPAKGGTKNLDPAAFGFNGRRAEPISEPPARPANVLPRLRELELEGV